MLVTMISPLAKQATYGGKLKLVSHTDQKNCHCNIFAAFDKYLFMEYIDICLVHTYGMGTSISGINLRETMVVK